MLKKYTFVGLLFCCLSFMNSFGQTTIAEQNFDGSSPNWSYTNDIAFFDNNFGTDGYYGILDIASANPLSHVNFSNNILAENDLDDEGNGTGGFANITFSTIDITAYNNVTLSFDYDIIGYNANNDDARYQVYYDGIGQGYVYLLDGNGAPEDANGSVNLNIPNTVNQVYLVIAIRNNGGSGYSGFDNFLLEGVPASTDTSVQFTSTNSTLTEDGLFIDVCVGITNASASNAATVDIALDAGSTATNGTDYDDGAGVPAAISFPQTLTFPANDTSDQCFTIYISNDDSILENDETIILNLTNPTGGDAASIGTNNQHTVTITDNDFYDDCASSINIPVNTSCITQSFTNVGASDSGIADPGCANYGGGDVWFNLTVPTSGSVTVETSNDGGITDSGMAFYTGACGSLTLLDCDDDSGAGNMSAITATGLTPGATLYVRVWEYNNNDFDTFAICAYASPEIDVERNTNASIPSGTCASNPPNTGNNTLFSATNIGDSSASKLYYIQNEGAADLTISSVSFANGVDFNFINLPSLPTTISPGDNISFEVEFTPSTTGSLEDTITIVSNDADESNYTFCVGGQGQCATTSISNSPTSGPVNTLVTVTGTNFTGVTTATVNGISTSVTVVSDTTLELNIPAGASTGSIEITNNLGCTASETFTVINNLIASCEGSGTLPSALFISEVTDHGSGSHSYVEIYNGTGTAINLSGYEIRVHNNGSATPTSTVALSGTVAHNDVFVLAFGSSDATDANATHGFDQSSAISGINNDDHIRLYNGSTWLDLWGDTSGTAFTVAPLDYTYRRKNTGITAPSTSWNASDWDTVTPVDYTDIGTYDYSLGTPPTINTQPSISASCDLTVTLSVNATEGYNGTSPADTQELTYQWYYTAPGDTAWTEVPDNATFDDVTEAALIINNVMTVLDYQFYCQVREDDAMCYQASNAVKIETNSTTWDGSSWDNGTPSTSTIAIIDGNYNTGANGNIDACQLLINSGYTLDVTNATYVRIVNSVVNDGTLSVQTRGAFVQDGAGIAGTGTSGTFTNNGIARVIKQTALLTNWYEYTYWSSPVTGQTINGAFPDTPADRRFSFNTANYWDEYIEVNNDNSNTVLGQDDIDDDGNVWEISNGTDTMSQGVGYAATSSPFGLYPGTDTATFTGAFNTGDYSTPIVINGYAPDNDWNFVGNPYASAIDFDDLYAANSTLIDGAAFLWSHATPPSDDTNGNENLNFAQTDYAIITIGSGNTAGGSGVIPDAGNYIPSGQGFFVKGNANGNLTFTNSMRRADTSSNGQFFEAIDTSDLNSNRLWVNLTSDNGVFNQILMAYVDGATDAYDGWAYDAPRNLSSNLSAVIYTAIENSDKKFAVQGKSTNSLSLNEVIPVGFKTTIEEATLYTFSIAQLEGDFLLNNTIYLVDHTMNIAHNLSEADYSFTSSPGEFNERFDIVFNLETLSLNTTNLSSSDLSIIENTNGLVQFSLSNPNLEMERIEILDMLGRTIYTLKATGNNETYNLANLSRATYIANVTLTNGQTITKKTVKRY